MGRYCLIIIMLALLAGTAEAADLGTPGLSDSIEKSWLTGQDRLVTSGGVKYGAGTGVTLEPLVGLGYGMRHLEQEGVGGEALLYKVHARAGGTMNLLDSAYVSAAAKLPVYSYETGDVRAAGPPPSSAGSRQDYDILKMQGKNLNWTGEVGMHLGLGADLSLYYDQNQFSSPAAGANSSRTDERFGTRIIIRFK